MTQPSQSSEHPSTYIVQDRENQEELARLTLLDRLLTESMGGVLAELPEPAALQRVLDIGCATGGWALETAQTYPTISLVIGIDISQRMITYARQQAQAAALAERVEFHVMDALRMLEFPSHFFDLVNLRLGGSWLRTWDWPKLLSEIYRVTRFGGIVRIIEQELLHRISSQAGARMNEMVMLAFYRAGHLFAPEATGLTAHLPSLLTRHKFVDVQERTYPLEYQAGTPATEAYTKDMVAASHTLRPFLQKWGCLSADYDQLCQQLAKDGESPDFHSVWTFHAIWARRA